jgi:hypothetical protein
MRKGMIIGISLFVVIIGVIGLVNSWNNVQNSQRDLAIAKQNVISACQDEKAALLNPDLSTYDYQTHFPAYNEKCAQYTLK